MTTVAIYLKTGDVISMEVSDIELFKNKFSECIDEPEKWLKVGEIHSEIYIPVSSINYVKIGNDLT